MKKLYIFFALLFLVFTACDIQKNNSAKPDVLFKVYNNKQYLQSYQPTQISQAADGNFIVLGKTRTETSSFPGVYLMLLKQDGTFVKDTVLGETYANPVSNLIAVNSSWYFFCMDPLTLATKLIKVEVDLSFSEVASFDGIIYPLAANFDGSNLLLLSYDRDNRASVISSISTSGNINSSKDFSIGFGDYDVEEPIIRHLTETGSTLPFSVGKLNNGRYYFNGFYNYTLSLVFFSFSSDDKIKPGVLQGYKSERGISSISTLPSGNLALSKFVYQSKYLLPSESINTADGAIASSSDLNGYVVEDLDPTARIVSKVVPNSSLIAYVSTTRNKQMAVFFYDITSKNLKKVKYYGYSNPYEAADIVFTNNNEEMILLGKTYLAGKFGRVCFFSIKRSELGI